MNISISHRRVSKEVINEIEDMCADMTSEGDEVLMMGKS